ncbi:ATP-binding protein [Almyronema epifaneia]|uniref:histidine kinase n=1 Tax=Almyronema epifaneia S1 TaxID=2991925 RepID=A0ABW6IAZ4_9CYAN
MSFHQFIAANEAVTLNNCDREPIHIPGLIQPHGIFFVLSEPDFTLVQLSSNTAVHLGIPPTQLLGRPLSQLLTSQQLDVIQQSLKDDFAVLNPLEITIQTDTQLAYFNGILHRSLQDKLILELEPKTADSQSNFWGFHLATKGILAKMQKAENLSQLCELMVKEVRRLTGFDRVMIYRFDTDGAGAVIAEDKQPDLEPYLGLHYPATDVPQQAKLLYTLNPLRLIPDVDYQPVPLLSTESATVAAEPLDLSLSILRSVSPVHLEYLKNMGVSASMSISLVQNKKLWGLISCHHITPKFVPYDTRTICEFLGQVMSLELASKEANENLDYKVRLKSIQAKFTDRISCAEEFTDALVKDRQELLDLVGADGAVVCTQGHLTQIGKVPSESQIQDLLEWLPNHLENDLLVTHALSTLYPPATTFQADASGLLALTITRVQKNFVLWFRGERLQQVTWAGNPDKPVQVEPDGSYTIYPRKSFEAWQQTVTGQSLPWLPCEIEGALELKSAIVGIALRKADELAAINLELERSNVELDAFTYIASHDLKEPLRGIHNYSTFLLEDYLNILDEEGVERLQTLVRLTKRMEDLINSLLLFARLGRQEMNLRPVDVNRLVNEVIEVFYMSKDQTEVTVQIAQPLPWVQGDRVLLEQVFTNLISNGLKYNTQTQKQIEIGVLPLADAALAAEGKQPMQTFYIRDNGIGIRERHLDSVFRIFKRLHGPGKYGGGTGAGLTIVKKIVERHGGKIWIESNYGTGSTFYFTLPT